MRKRRKEKRKNSNKEMKKTTVYGRANRRKWREDQLASQERVWKSWRGNDDWSSEELDREKSWALQEASANQRRQNGECYWESQKTGLFQQWHEQKKDHADDGQVLRPGNFSPHGETESENSNRSSCKTSAPTPAQQRKQPPEMHKLHERMQKMTEREKEKDNTYAFQLWSFQLAFSRRLLTGECWEVAKEANA